MWTFNQHKQNKAKKNPPKFDKILGCYNFVAFLCIFQNEPINEMPQCQFPVFSCFVFQKSYTGNILGIGQNKSRTSYFFPEAPRSSKMRWRGAKGPPHPRVVRPMLGPHHLGVRPAGPPADAALPPIYSPRWEKPKSPFNFPRNILQAAAVVDVRSGGSRSSSQHPTGEGNHRRRPSPPQWSPPEWCVSSLPWTTGP
jgi:hypothetical protein